LTFRVIVNQKAMDSTSAELLAIPSLIEPHHVRLEEVKSNDTNFQTLLTHAITKKVGFELRVNLSQEDVDSLRAENEAIRVPIKGILACKAATGRLLIKAELNHSVISRQLNQWQEEVKFFRVEIGAFESDNFMAGLPLEEARDRLREFQSQEKVCLGEVKTLRLKQEAFVHRLDDIESNLLVHESLLKDAELRYCDFQQRLRVSEAEVASLRMDVEDCDSRIRIKQIESDKEGIESRLKETQSDQGPASVPLSNLMSMNGNVKNGLKEVEASDTVFLALREAMYAQKGLMLPEPWSVNETESDKNEIRDLKQFTTARIAILTGRARPSQEDVEADDEFGSRLASSPRSVTEPLEASMSQILNLESNKQGTHATESRNAELECRLKASEELVARLKLEVEASTSEAKSIQREKTRMEELLESAESRTAEVETLLKISQQVDVCCSKKDGLLTRFLEPEKVSTEDELVYSESESDGRCTSCVKDSGLLDEKASSLRIRRIKSRMRRIELEKARCSSPDREHAVGVQQLPELSPDNALPAAALLEEAKARNAEMESKVIAYEEQLLSLQKEIEALHLHVKNIESKQAQAESLLWQAEAKTTQVEGHWTMSLEQIDALRNEQVAFISRIRQVESDKAATERLWKEATVTIVELRSQSQLLCHTHQSCKHAPLGKPDNHVSRKQSSVDDSSISGKSRSSKRCDYSTESGGVSVSASVSSRLMESHQFFQSLQSEKEQIKAQLARIKAREKDKKNAPSESPPNEILEEKKEAEIVQMKNFLGVGNRLMESTLAKC
jgi:chromosome segregation ATPase